MADLFIVVTAYSHRSEATLATAWPDRVAWIL
jgi:hypothetical protein